MNSHLLSFLCARAPFGALCIVMSLLFVAQLTAESAGLRPTSTVVVDSARAKARTPKVPHRKVLSDSLRTVTTGPIVVTGTRGEVQIQDSPVRVELVETGGYKASASTNLGQLLEDQAGVGISNSLHSGVQLQGMSADYTQILVDGQPLIGRVAGVVDLSRISMANIKQVEIVKGPMSSLYGSEALAGVINLITERPAPGWSASCRSQYLQRQGEEGSVNVGFSNDDIDWTFSLAGKTSPAFSLSSDSITIPYSGFNDFTAQSRFRMFVAPRLSLSANLRYFDSRSQGLFVESYFGQIAANQGSVGQHEGGLQLAADWIVGKAHVNAQLYASDFKEEYHFDVVQGSGSSVDDFHRRYYKPSIQYDVMANDRNRLMLGIEYTADYLDGTRYSDDPAYHTSIAYTQWEGNPTDWISYALSARFDANSEYGSNLSPKFSTLLKLSDRLQLRASIGTGFKAPDFRQLFVMFRNNLQGAGYVLMGARLLNHTLEAERSLAYEASMNTLILDESKSISGSLRCSADLRLFRNTVTNLIEYYLDHIEGSVAVYSYHNVAHIRTQGVETSINLAYSLNTKDEIQFRASYQYLDAADTDVLTAIDNRNAGSIDSKTGSFIPLTRAAYGGLWFRSTHLLNLKLEYLAQSGLAAAIRADYVGRFGDEALDKNVVSTGSVAKTILDRDDEYVPGYWNVKASIFQEIQLSQSVLSLRSFGLGCGVVNALNVMNLRSLPGLLGRQFYINLRCSW